MALDMAEEFRPLLADSVVLTLINNGEVGEASFVRRAGAVAMTDAGRRAVIAAYERRMDTLVTHPVFGYRISYRRVLEVQARLLARALLGEINGYPFSARGSRSRLPGGDGKRGQAPFVRSTLRAVPANGACPLFPRNPSYMAGVL